MDNDFLGVKNIRDHEFGGLNFFVFQNFGRSNFIPGKILEKLLYKVDVF